jgi:hypothetical protein
MKYFDKYFFSILIGMAFPFILCLLSVVIWFYVDKSDRHFALYSITGLIIGLLIDGYFLKGWIRNMYRISPILILIFYIIYNIGLYGFFMGFPVFNSFLGLIAGYYYGKKISFEKIAGSKQISIKRQVLLISGLIMTLICIPTGLMAFEGSGVGGMIESILGLDFKVTNLMIWGIIIVGGITLIFVQIFLTRFAMGKTIENDRSNIV